MPRISAWVSGVALILSVAGCQREPQPVTESMPYRASASVQEIMQAIVDPAADRVWESVGSTLTADKVDERQPRTDEEWLAVRHGVLTLMEATNLLMMPGRKMVPSGGKLLDEGSEGVLTTVAAQKKLDEQHAAFVQFASALHDVSTRLLKAADEKDVKALFDIGTEMDTVCEGCHTTFWYPEQPIYKAEKGSIAK